MRRRPDLRWRSRRIPTELRFRTIWADPSSKLTKRVFSRRRQAASANAPASVDLAVPGAPEIRMLVPRK
jgi:hypothetical protein